MRPSARGMLILAASGLLFSSPLWAQTEPAVPTTEPAAATTAPATTAPATESAVDEADVLATVNGRPLSESQFYHQLMLMEGPKLFQEVVSLTLAHQACDAAGIKITPEMVQAEEQRVYENLHQQGVPEDKVQQAFMIVLQRQGISPIEAQIGLERTACLRALGKGQGAPVTQADIEQAFSAEYGEKAEVRDIVVPSLADGAEIRRLVTKEGKTVDEVIAERHLQSQLVTISKNATNVPATLTHTAFELKQGELSGVIPLSQGPVVTYHLLYKVRDVPANHDVKLPDVQDKIKTALSEQRDMAYAQNKLQQMMADAHVQVRDPVLGQLLKSRMAQAQAARESAAAPAAPATRPAPAGPMPAPAAPLPGM